MRVGSAVTWTTRLRKDAALYGLPPARTGRRGRPRTKGDRLPALAKLAATAGFTEVTVTRYGKTAAVSAAAVTCLWPSVFATRAVTVVLIRDRSAACYDLALVTTDTAATAAPRSRLGDGVGIRPVWRDGVYLQVVVVEVRVRVTAPAKF
jgi:hypothetical protein